MAYTIKFTSKFAGRDDVLGKLETLCGIEGHLGELQKVPCKEWRWRMMMRVPEFIKKRDLDAARTMPREKGKEGDFDAVRLETLEEECCARSCTSGRTRRCT